MNLTHVGRVFLALSILAASSTGCWGYHRRYYGQPVYVAPQPVYMAPRPVYVAPQPVYMAPPPVVYVR